MSIAYVRPELLAEMSFRNRSSGDIRDGVLSRYALASMLEQRNPKRDVCALALLAGCVFLALALGTYRPIDPPSHASWPPPEQIHNACGRAGAWIADYLFESLGYGAYFLLVTLVVIDLFLLARKTINEPCVRGIGWSLALAGISTLAALAAPRWEGPLIGPGGYLGASGRAWLENHFASAGSYVLTLSMIAAGLLLCTDYFLVTLTGRVFGGPAKSLAAVGKRTLRRTPRVASDLEVGPNGFIPEAFIPKTDAKSVKAAAKSKAVDDTKSDADEEEEELSSIRIKSKPPKPAAAVVEDEDEDDEDEEDDEDAEEESDDDNDEEESDVDEEPAVVAPALPVVAAKPESNPRIKKKAKNDDRVDMMKELDAASRKEDAAEYQLPPIDLLLENEIVYGEEHEKEVRIRAKQIEKTFADFGFNVKVVEIETGPVIAQYEIELEAGLKLSKITGLSDDLAIALRVPSVRIVAPIPGKNTVGIEVPNNTRQLVRLREVIEETDGKAKKMKIPIYLGKDVAGNSMVVDLTTMPHLLIAGRTGTGKSVCLNTIIVSMLMSRKPDEVKMLMIDPKMVELTPYKTLPHLMHPVVTDMRKAEAILAWAVEKMEERYALLARAGVRHITVFNQLGEEELRKRLDPESDEEWSVVPKTLPFIVIIADELADLMMTAGKEVEQHIIRLAQKSRAVGIHLILATQKPTVDVITGLIKSNLPARIAFQVASRTDSRVVLDENGADKLLGNGDMLFLWPGTSTLLRGQGTYLSDEEINSVVEHVGTTEPDFVKELVQLKTKDQQDGDAKERIKSRDELYPSAVEAVLRENRGSVSLLQRCLGIGYGRAARMIDYMAEDGIVGEYNGSNAREILMTMEQWREMMGEAPDEPPPPSAPARRNRITPERGGGGDAPSRNPGESGGARIAGDSPARPHAAPEGGGVATATKASLKLNGPAVRIDEADETEDVPWEDAAMIDAAESQPAAPHAQFRTAEAYEAETDETEEETTWSPEDDFEEAPVVNTLDAEIASEGDDESDEDVDEQEEDDWEDDEESEELEHDEDDIDNDE
ncbi:MAG: DNA translocase FtsK [Pirellulales bacterium]